MIGAGFGMSLTKQGLAPVSVHTYDTRPMRDDGSKLCNVVLLAEESRRLELAVPLAALVRVAPALLRHDGIVSAQIAFTREAGRNIADVQISAQLVLRCQRCLEAMTLPVSSASRVALLGSEAEADTVPVGLETALAPEGKLRPVDLIEEELLLALPAAARHSTPCVAAPMTESSEELVESPQRPFANLGKLLQAKRSKQ
jgi:uncharacterized protein